MLLFLIEEKIAMAITITYYILRITYIYIYTHHHKKISILYVLRWLMGWSIPRHFHKPFLGPSSVHCAMLTFVAAPLSAHAVAPVREAQLAREGRGSGLVGWSSNEWRLYMISMGIYCNWIWWPLNPLIVWVRWIWLYIYIYTLWLWLT